MKAIVKHTKINKEEPEGFYYIQLEGTSFVLCEEPDVPVPIIFSDREEKEKAQKLTDQINKELKELQNRK